MKNGFLLLLIVLLAGAAWLLLGDSSDEGEPGLESGDLLAGEHAGDPALHADGRVPDGGTLPGTGPTAPPEQGEDAADRLTFEGRVVSERRAPVAGAEVRLIAGTRVLAAATSDAEGRYGLSVPSGGRPEGARAALIGKTADGRTAVASVWLTVRAGRKQTLPTLALARSFDLEVRVAREGAGVLGATVAAVRRGAGVPLLLATASGDEEGRVRLEKLPAGTVELFATAPGHGRGRLLLRLPRPADALPATIALQGERVLSVQVVDSRTSRPISGATVLVGDARTMPEPHGPGYLPALPPLRTDRSGYAIVRRLGAAETLYVNARAPGYAFQPWWRSKSQIAAPTVGEVRIALSRARVVRFPVVEDEEPAPVEGTLLRVDARGLQRDTGGAGVSARIEGGYVVVEGLGVGRSTGTFVAPSGQQAPYRLEAGAEEGTTVTFRTPRSVRVRVVEPGGVPVADLGLRLNAGGRAPAVAPAVTDEEGLAVFDGVGADRASLHLHVSDQPFGGPSLATLDLTSDIEVHEVVLQPGVQLVLRLRIEGVERLPSTYTLLVGGTRFDPAQITEDAAAGTLSCTVRPPSADGPVRIALHPHGFLAESLELDPRDRITEETFDLRPAGRLVVRVTPPDDAEYTLQLERLKDEDEWVPAQLPIAGSAGAPLRRAVPDPDGTHTYEGLAPGRYRVLERRSRQLSKAVDVAVGAQVEMAFDLSGAEWIQGRVTAPQGTNLAQARVLVEGRHTGSSSWQGVRATSDGSFRVRASRDHALTLRVTHPTLSPAARGGRVTVRAGVGEVELRLEHGPEIQFRVVGFEKATTPPSGLWHAPLHVHLVPEGKDGGAAHAVQPVARDGLFRAGGYTPGTYTLWVTFGREHAPYVQRGVVLGQSTVDLGTLQPPRGSTLRIRLAGLAQRPSAAVWATVNHEGKPAYARHGQLDRTAEELVSRGLGAGRFRVIVRGAGLAPGASSARVLLDRVVRVDGTSDLTLDLRLP